MVMLENIMNSFGSNVRGYFAIALGLFAAWQAVTTVYNVLFHPLRKFPGPLIQRASGLPWAIRHASGSQAFHTHHLHEQYGPVVRIGPNHLSFTDPKAWNDIYGHRVGSGSKTAEMPKAAVFSRTIRAIPTSIINADREEHQRIRRALAHGFSDSSMRQQEPLIMEYVDLLVDRLHQGSGDGKTVLNIEAWFNYTTFDIVGSLVFGQSFGCLKNTEYHPWIKFIINAVRLGSVIVAMSYVGLDSLVQLVFRGKGIGAIKQMRKYTNKLVKSRLDMGEGRDDLFEGLVKKREEWDLSFEKLSANAFILVLAGSETTATTLSGATYLLLTHPHILEKLTQEVRSSFKNKNDITIASVGKLTYMLCVLNESLRLYPPVTAGLVREVPQGGGEEIAGRYVPAGSYVEVQHWSANHSSDNWTDPWSFQPERFLNGPEKGGDMGNKLEALQAFNVGPRNCIGRNLAYAEMRIILARLIYDFDLTLADDSKHWIERQKAFPLWNRIPLNVYLKSRG